MGTARWKPVERQYCNGVTRGQGYIKGNKEKETIIQE